MSGTRVTIGFFKVKCIVCSKKCGVCFTAGGASTVGSVRKVSCGGQLVGYSLACICIILNLDFDFTA